MAEQINPRDLVVDILLAVNRDGEYSHIAVRGVLDKYRYLPRRDRAFLKRVSEGSIERRLELDYIIDAFSKTKVKKMKPVIRAILESAVYQIKYMDAVPDSAVCNEAVKLAKKRGFSGLSGFVNGVLRNISRNLAGVEFPSVKTEPIRALSVRYSMPEWIVEKWMAQFGTGRCGRMLAAFLEKQKTCVRVDTRKCSVREVRASLEAQGISVEPVRLVENSDIERTTACESNRSGDLQRERASLAIDDAFYIDGYDVLDEIPEFESGVLYAQDVSSMMVARLAAEDLRDGGKLGLTKSDTMTDSIENGSIFALDVCAAPGGKSIHLAQLLRGRGRVEARDLTEYKTELIEENKERCGADNLTVNIWDATVFDAEMEHEADIVIADLPCSGLGVIGGKTDIKYKAFPEKITELAQLQRRILSTVKRYVKPGGVLLYSTCTIAEGENQENLAWFLTENPQFTLEYERQFLPDEGCDGFYIAKLRLVY